MKIEYGAIKSDRRKRVKIICNILLLLMLSLLTACSGSNSDEQTAETGITEDFSMPEKKINPTRYSELPLAAEEAGFDFYSLNEFSNGYKFSSFYVGEWELLDEKKMYGIGEFVTRVKVTYKHPNGLFTVTVSAYPVDEPPERSVMYEWTKEIEGTEVSLDIYILRMVLNDHERTEEDQALIDSGKGSLSCDGETEGDSYHYTLYFVKDGIYYEFRDAIEEYLSLEEFVGMVEEFLQTAELQSAQ